MTTTQVSSQPSLMSRLVNRILAIKPLATFAKHQAREMMMNRAEKIGVPWRDNVRQLRSHDWDKEMATIENPNLTYPDYYLCSFHAYETGNLNWDAALEVESAAYAVHATIWPDAGVEGDRQLRHNYHKALKQQIPIAPQTILDIGCSVGMSTEELQATYPQSQITGIDLSPYYLAVAQYRSKERQANIKWVHAAAESTGLADGSVDLVSAFLMFHELPQSAAKAILAEARRLLGDNGYLAIMDMNPSSEVYKKLPPYVLTLLKSTEPYLDEYFTLDIKQAIIEAGFASVTITSISPRHRAIIAYK